MAVEPVVLGIVRTRGGVNLLTRVEVERGSLVMEMDSGR